MSWGSERGWGVHLASAQEDCAPRAARKFPPTSKAALIYLGLTAGETEAHSTSGCCPEAEQRNPRPRHPRSRTPELNVLAWGGSWPFSCALVHLFSLIHSFSICGTRTWFLVCGLPGEPLARRQVPRHPHRAQSAEAAGMCSPLAVSNRGNLM